MMLSIKVLTTISLVSLVVGAFIPGAVILSLGAFVSACLVMIWNLGD